MEISNTARWVTIVSMYMLLSDVTHSAAWTASHISNSPTQVAHDTKGIYLFALLLDKPRPGRDYTKVFVKKTFGVLCII